MRLQSIVNKEMQAGSYEFDFDASRFNKWNLFLQTSIRQFPSNKKNDFNKIKKKEKMKTLIIFTILFLSQCLVFAQHKNEKNSKSIDFDGSGFYPEIHSNKNESLKSEKKLNMDGVNASQASIPSFTKVTDGCNSNRSRSFFRMFLG